LYPLLKTHLRVLLAEGEPVTARLIEQELDIIGAQLVGKAPDGGQAVEMTHILRPDLVLIDADLPRQSGIESTRKILSTCPTPIVMLSDYSESPIMTQMTAAGVGACLVKPPQVQDLERALLVAQARFRDLLEIRRLRAQLHQALADIKRLTGILPICMYCHRIRTDQQIWEQLELYLTEHSDARFTHGVCPACAQSHYPELYGEKPGLDCSVPDPV
jgi:AmiR/NasT family two-component response regulator